MERTSQPSVSKRQRSGKLAERGATMVEYALVFALVAVVALGAMEFLVDRSEVEINNQADCVSERPPPSACGFAPVPSDVTYPDPGFSPPTSAPPNAEEIPTFEFGSGSEDFATGWAVLVPVRLTRAVSGDPPLPPEPLSGVRVRAAIRMEDPTNAPNELAEIGYTDCVTASDGWCTLRYDIPYDDVDIVRLRIIGIDTTPAPDIPTDVATFDRNT